MQRPILTILILVTTAHFSLSATVARGQDIVTKPTWEFKAVSFSIDDKEGTRKLNELADSGWEYVGPLTNGVIAFRRQTGAISVITFAGLDTSKGTASRDHLAKYLDQFGMRITAFTPGTEVSVMAGSTRVVRPKYPNHLSQHGSTKPITFTLSFATPADSVDFTRPGLLAETGSGITHPVWTATAFDTHGKKIDSVGEKLISSFKDVPAARFTLTGLGIMSIRFDSDCQGFAATAGVLLDDFVVKMPPPRR
jgi:hypothetical protein